MAQAVTLSDVARAAGVSVATASRALNGSTRTVRPDLSDRVLAAARQLDYAPNGPAQAVARGTTSVVGLVVHDIADPYFSAIAAGVSRAADESGLLVMLSSTTGRADHELRYLRALRAQRGRAVILAGSRRIDPAHDADLTAEIAAYEQAGGRVVAISQPQLPVDTIVIDNRTGAADLAGALLGLGYRRFGVLAGPADLATARDRREGFARCVVDAGHPSPVAVHGNFTRDGGYAAMTELLELHRDLDCVFAVNDVMAMGAIAACREYGVRVPQELALAGFDDIATLRDVAPTLTTVRLPLVELGAEALRLIIEPPAAEPRRRQRLGDVVLRASTPPRR